LCPGSTGAGTTSGCYAEISPMPSSSELSTTGASSPLTLEKVYEPQRFEPHWAEWWIDTGLFHVRAEDAQPGRTFSLVIPPPNVTGSLHIGHMLDHTIMDVAVRWHRMKGETTLWLPGIDHAGIATQMVVERQLNAEGLNRKQLGREEFERRVWQWKEEYGGRITQQIRREGASVDWSRERFTMDEGLSRAVREAFVRLWEKGLIYRGEYMVNWCPQCQTAISDVETIHESVDGHLWHIRYKVTGTDETVTVATTRPETMLGDTALVVHPEDSRYQHLVGKSALVPIVGREIPILADSMVDPKFGTGVVKVTPAHDPNDFEVGKRHNLPSIKVIGEDARMTEAAGAAYAGLDRFEARKRIAIALEESGDLAKTEPYVLSVAKCDRSKTIIEPLVSNQWFVRMKPLAERAMSAVRARDIRFVPDDREAVFFQWMENIHDWCISRQLWWGHRIPAWHCRSCKQVTIARETPAVCPHCQSTEVEQETDVLDTWFSSGLWPFSTLGWPDDTADLRAFYPTTLLITGFDILFFWVSRMIVLGLEMTDQAPFREVHMHGLVRDAERQKMSKTKGNVVDPLEIMDRFGTDACRVGLLISAATGADIALKEDRLVAGRGFANKLWNASRLLFMNMERSGIHSWTPGEQETPEAIEDVWIFERLRNATDSVNRALAVHRYHEVAQTLWDFSWHEFCDWYLEVKKFRFAENSGLDGNWRAALTVYERMLRLLHPVMPFITEELWQRLIHGAGQANEQARSIALTRYPEPLASKLLEEKVSRFELLKSVVEAARKLRIDTKLDAKSSFPADLYLHDNAFETDELEIVSSLTRLQMKQHKGSLGERSGLVLSSAEFDIQIHAEPPSTNGHASGDLQARVQKESAQLEKVIASTERQLNDSAFVTNAPTKVVEGMKTKLAEYRSRLEKNRELLASMN
jgi:valyl-tRNA synthetase